MKFGKQIALIFLIPLIITVAFSCRKSVDPCNTNNPAKDFPWLEMHLDSIEREPCNIEVHIFEYRGNHAVYAIGCSALDESSLLFDCTGSLLCEFNISLGVNTCPDFDGNNEYIGQVYP